LLVSHICLTSTDLVNPMTMTTPCASRSLASISWLIAISSLGSSRWTNPHRLPRIRRWTTKSRSKSSATLLDSSTSTKTGATSSSRWNKSRWQNVYLLASKTGLNLKRASDSWSSGWLKDLILRINRWAVIGYRLVHPTIMNWSSLTYMMKIEMHIMRTLSRKQTIYGTNSQQEPKVKREQPNWQLKKRKLIFRQRKCSKWRKMGKAMVKTQMVNSWRRNQRFNLIVQKQRIRFPHNLLILIRSWPRTQKNPMMTVLTVRMTS